MSKTRNAGVGDGAIRRVGALATYAHSGLRRGAYGMSKVWIGTSGWTYDGWRGPFYPKDVEMVGK